jgi:hypothetical protein
MRVVPRRSRWDKPEGSIWLQAILGRFTGILPGFAAILHAEPV